MRFEITVRTVVFGVAFPLGFPEEDHDHLTGHVVRREDCCDQADDVKHWASRQGKQQDFIFGPETSEWGDTSNCKPSDDECAGRNRHHFAQGSHPTHVLLVVHAVNHRT